MQFSYSTNAIFILNKCNFHIWQMEAVCGFLDHSKCKTTKPFKHKNTELTMCWCSGPLAMLVLYGLHLMGYICRLTLFRLFQENIDCNYWAVGYDRVAIRREKKRLKKNRSRDTCTVCAFEIQNNTTFGPDTRPKAANTCVSVSFENRIPGFAKCPQKHKRWIAMNLIFNTIHRDESRWILDSSQFIGDSSWFTKATSRSAHICVWWIAMNPVRALWWITMNR